MKSAMMHLAYTLTGGRNQSTCGSKLLASTGCGLSSSKRVSGSFKVVALTFRFHPSLKASAFSRRSAKELKVLPFVKSAQLHRRALKGVSAFPLVLSERGGSRGNWCNY